MGPRTGWIAASFEVYLCGLLFHSPLEWMVKMGQAPGCASRSSSGPGHLAHGSNVELQYRVRGHDKRDMLCAAARTGGTQGIVLNLGGDEVVSRRVNFGSRQRYVN